MSYADSLCRSVAVLLHADGSQGGSVSVRRRILYSCCWRKLGLPGWRAGGRAMPLLAGAFDCGKGHVYRIFGTV